MGVGRTLDGGEKAKNSNTTYKIVLEYIPHFEVNTLRFPTEPLHHGTSIRPRTSTTHFCKPYIHGRAGQEDPCLGSKEVGGMVGHGSISVQQKLLDLLATGTRTHEKRHSKTKRSYDQVQIQGQQIFTKCEDSESRPRSTRRLLDDPLEKYS